MSIMISLMQVGGVDILFSLRNIVAIIKKITRAFIKHGSTNEIMIRLHIMMHVLYDLLWYLSAPCIDIIFLFNEPKYY
jgi:hypothetical protein